jgi:hypothetical protein
MIYRQERLAEIMLKNFLCVLVGELLGFLRKLLLQEVSRFGSVYVETRATWTPSSAQAVHCYKLTRSKLEDKGLNMRAVLSDCNSECVHCIKYF